MAKAKLKSIAILTGGGDCPGLNAVIRAVTDTQRRWIDRRCAAEADILDFAAKHPGNVLVRESDGMSRRPRYSNVRPGQAEDALKNHANPKQSVSALAREGVAR